MTRRNRRPFSAPSGTAQSRELPVGIHNLDGRTLVYSTEGIPAPEHFFYATDVWVDRKGSELFLFFGERPIGDGSDECTRALQIVFAIPPAREFLFRNLFINHSARSDAPFAARLKTALELDANIYGLESSINRASERPARPRERSQFRMFSANFATFAYSEGQGMVEFLLMPPDTIANLVNGQPTRRGAGLKPIVSILMSMPTLDSFLNSLHLALKPVMEPASKEDA